MFAGFYETVRVRRRSSDRCFTMAGQHDRHPPRVQRGDRRVRRRCALRARRRLVRARPRCVDTCASSSATPAARSSRSSSTSTHPKLEVTIRLAARLLHARAAVATPALHDGVAERGRQAGAALGDDPVSAIAHSGATRRRPRRRASPTTPVCSSRFGGMLLIDYLPTRVVELTVHTLDITDALDCPPTVRSRRGRPHDDDHGEGRRSARADPVARRASLAARRLQRLRMTTSRPRTRAARGPAGHRRVHRGRRPGVRPLPRRLRRRRDQGRAPRRRRHAAQHGLARPARRRHAVVEARRPRQADDRPRPEGTPTTST